ncbi:arylsulfatase [Larkinella sp. VNQ87]|uniref:arylsulfatase n=1 Tax=Larkinella sp. VNQ87 TaxID=3400921 RepID=UPI003C0901CE
MKKRNNPLSADRFGGKKNRSMVPNPVLSFLVLTLVGVLTSLAPAPKSAPLGSKPVSKPNIIYILMDDLGVEEIVPYGKNILKTPHLSRMVREGLVFTQHYAGTSVCAPSRCALMTGMHTGHCEVRGNKQMEPHGQMPISSETVTVAELLKDAGYETALFGKWGLGIEGTTGEPTRQGFDQYYGYLDQVLAHNNFPAYLVRNGHRELLPNEVIWEPETALFKGLGSFTPEPKVYSNDLFTKEGVQFLEKPHSKPFFLYLSYTLPHNNGEAPKNQRFQAPTLAPYENEPWTPLEKNYAATITRMDEYVGQIMATLKARGLDKNTLVLFTSDNGSTEDIPERFARANQLRGMKRSPYEGGIRAPLIAWWPGQIKPGASDLPTAQWDFLATACELAGVRPPAHTDSRSIVPTLLGRKGQPLAPYLYWEFHEQGGWQAIRQGHNKLIFKVKTGQYELYDLQKDPGEKTNRIDQEPGLANRLKTLLAAARTPSKDFNFGK